MFAAFQPTLYVQISPERLSVKNVKTGETIAEVPEVALSASPKPKLLGVGAQARVAAAGGAAKIVNPFAHPRSLVSDFTVAEQLLKAFFRRLQGSSLFAVSPVVVMHPLGHPNGGFTQVEKRAFHEMALGAGAAQVILWQGRNLTDPEILSRQFPAGGVVGE